MSFKRREFIKLAGVSAAAAAVGMPSLVRASSSVNVTIIGGGYGGAAATKYVHDYLPNANVTLIEKNEFYYSCPFSNEVLGGDSKMDDIKFSYDNIAARGIKVVIDEVTGVDTDKKSIATKSNGNIAYDYLIVSPGIDYRWDTIEGLSAEVAETKMPHAWKAGPQTALLRKQLVEMKDGGTVMIVAPPNPFRCPPGPYERAAQIAHYLKHHKPKSKLIIMDSKDKFSKQGLFMEGYKQHYAGIIEWRKAADDGKVLEVDAASGTLITEFDEHTPDVANVIPAQKAGALAFQMGLTNDKGWCPVDQHTFESSVHKDVYVIGDSCIAGKMPKSGYAANSQGKVCAAAIAAKVGGYAMPDQSFLNTCYSLITPDHGISVAAVYKLDKGTIVGVKGAGGLSPMGASAGVRKAEAMYARSWFRNITTDLFG